MQITGHPSIPTRCVNALSKGMSFAEAADTINARFHTAYSRNAALGRAKRMGFVGPRPARGAAVVATKVETTAAVENSRTPRRRTEAAPLSTRRSASNSAASRSCRAICR